MQTPEDIHGKHSVEAQEILRLRTALHTVEIRLAGATSWDDLRLRTRDVLDEVRLVLGPARPPDAISYPELTEAELERIRDRCFRQGELPFSASQDALRLVHEVKRLRMLVPAEIRDAAPALAFAATKRRP